MEPPIVSNKFAFLPSCIVALAIAGCGGGNGSDPIRIPPNPAEQWTVAAPSEAGMDGATLGMAVSTLPAAHGLASMVVLRHGKPVLEQYWNGYDKDTMHDMRSATKSITALMVGIAADQNMLAGADEPVALRLAGAYPNAPALKQDMRLRDLLTMSSGLACDDSDGNSPGNEENMYPKTDWISFFVNLPSIAVPGTRTRYCTAGVVALGRVVAEASRKSIPDFATTYLFGPIGVHTVRWASFDGGKQTDTGGHLYMRPRDMARVGQMVLQGGLWDGKRVVSSEWIARATTEKTQYPDGRKYGYLWWLRQVAVNGKVVNMHYANGNGGQYIFIVPEAELVVVFTGENYNSPKAALPFDIMEKYVFPSLR